MEVFSISLVFKYNSFQRAKFNNFTQQISGYIHNNIHSFSQYLSLKQLSNQLVEENERLRNQLSFCRQYSEKLATIYDTTDYTIQDTSAQYQYISAKVVNNSINKQYNYITINKGGKDGVKKEMGVISANGVVGIIQYVSPRFSIVLPLLNRRLKISAKIKKNGYYGSLYWEGKGYRKVTLHEIPYHVNVKKDDEIVTSGYSAIFPEDITIGKIIDYNLKQGNFYDIKVLLATDFKHLSYVYIINNKLKKEQKKIEKQIDK